MKFQSIAFLVAGGLALGLPSLAQETGQKQGAKTAAQEASAPQRVEVSLPVKGLTQENTAKAQQALDALQMSEFTCDKCAFAQAEAGECPACKTALTAHQRKRLASSALAADKQTLTFHLEGGADVSLSQIDNALRPLSIHVDRENLKIQGARIVFNGVKTPEDAKSIETLVQEAKLIRTAKLDRKDGSTEASFKIERGAAPVAFTAINGITKPANASWSVADVVWTSERNKAKAK